MNSFEAYELYIAIKTHFTTKYDFHLYQGKTTTSVSKFEARPDKYFFFKIAKKYSKAKLIDLFVANFVGNPDLWIGDLLDETSEEVYTQWQKRIECLTYHFSEECRELLGWTENKGYKFNDLFKVEDSDHPIIVKMCLQRVISLETFVILNQILNFGNNLNKEIDDIIWKDLWFKIKKYEPFLSININKCKTILKEMVEKDFKTLI
jgi:hypothetical protein